MIELLQFRHSPYNEKVRWALDLKGVPHTRRTLLPGPHIGVLKKLTGRTTTPVLVVDGGTGGSTGVPVIDGSTAIVEWLDRQFPQPRLLPDDAAEREAVLAIVRRYDEHITPRGRRAVLAALLRKPGYFARVFGDGQPHSTQWPYSLVVPLAAPLIRRGNGITGAASVDDGLCAFDEGLDEVAAMAAPLRYFVGGRFTLADLTVAATLAVGVDPPDSPMALPQPIAVPMRAIVERCNAHPGAAWVREIYARHRGRRDDFDGPSG